MADSTVQFVTQMKLRELNRQRDKLREAYRQLTEQIAQTSSAQERLRLLYEGLRDLKFAGRPLHPEVANLEILFYETEAGALSAEVLALWLQRLEAELSAGQVRSEFVSLFGALLEEWTREESEDPALQEERLHAQQDLLAKALTAPEPNRHQELLDPLVVGIRPKKVNYLKEILGTSVTKHEMETALKKISNNIYQSPRIRREARQFAANAILRQELSDALTILLSDLETWDWPAEGVKPRTLWTRNKWRLYLEEDLPTTCLLEIVGRRFLRSFNRHTPTGEALVQFPLLRGVEETIPPLFRWEIGETASDSSLQSDSKTRQDEPGWSSISYHRYEYLNTWLHLDDAEYEEYKEGNQAIQLIHAEIQLTRAAFLRAPIFVVKLDLKDFYASLPHDVLQTILQQIGMAEKDRAFFLRFLTPPLKDEGQGSMRTRQGVPMGHLLSDILAELPMSLLERFVLQKAQVRIVRQVDDLCILTSCAEDAIAAWRGVEEFCRGCGIQMNQEKAGAVCLGGSLPIELPQALPRWGLLELNAEAQWQVNQEAFEAHLEQSRKHLSAAGPVLSRVQQYNAGARYLASGLSFGLDLGERHRTEIKEAVKQFHLAFFGPGKGIEEGLCMEIRERFQRDSESPASIPEGWVYWPITAGGMGLHHPVVMAGQYQEAYRLREPKTAPANRSARWNLESNKWSEYYEHLLESLDLENPEETKTMEALVADFIERGADISAGQQKGLTAYWRWILSIYGPQILQQFGTFRFLITELVPLQLIRLQRIQDTSLDSVDSSAEEMNDADPFADE